MASLGEAYGLFSQPKDYLEPLSNRMRFDQAQKLGAINEAKKEKDYTKEYDDTLKLLNPEKYHKTDINEAFGDYNNLLKSAMTLKEKDPVLYRNQFPLLKAEFLERSARLQESSRMKKDWEKAYAQGKLGTGENVKKYNEYLRTGNRELLDSLTPSMFGSFKGFDERYGTPIMAPPNSISDVNKFIGTAIYGDAVDEKTGQIIRRVFDPKVVEENIAMAIQYNPDFVDAVMVGREDVFKNKVKETLGIDLIANPEALQQNPQVQEMLTNEIKDYVYSREPHIQRPAPKGSTFNINYGGTDRAVYAKVEPMYNRIAVEGGNEIYSRTDGLTLEEDEKISFSLPRDTRSLTTGKLLEQTSNKPITVQFQAVGSMPFLTAKGAAALKSQYGNKDYIAEGAQAPYDENNPELMEEWYRKGYIENKDVAKVRRTYEGLSAEEEREAMNDPSFSQEYYVPLANVWNTVPKKSGKRAEELEKAYQRIKTITKENNSKRAKEATQQATPQNPKKGGSGIQWQ